MEYYDWKSIGYKQAQNALDKGAKIWKLPCAFGSAMANFTHGLQTSRGACYVISARTLQSLTIPPSAWPESLTPAIGNHRSPFGPGA